MPLVMLDDAVCEIGHSSHVAGIARWRNSPGRQAKTPAREGGGINYCLEAPATIQ
jgi:hypothetical protein